jgi:isopenicillin-N N-acyltransferase like protein
MLDVGAGSHTEFTCEDVTMMQEKRFPVVEMQGSHFEMGQQYGQQCRGLIRDLSAQFDGIFVPDATRHRAARGAMVDAVPFVRAAAPALIEEVEGIASGADLSFEDAFRMNCSAEMGQWRGCQEQRSAVSIAEADECTTLAACTNTATLVAWNMDWHRLLQPYMVLLKGRPDDGPAFLAFALAGSVGRPGLSESIAISANQLPYRSGPTPPGADGPAWAGPGVPYCFLSRMLLEQESTAAALELLERTRRMGCLNYTLGDATGDICCVETTPTAQAVLPREESFVTHANSYHSPRFSGLPQAERERRDPRAHAAQTLLLDHRGRVERDVITMAQRYHFPGQCTGVCHHTETTMTLLSFVAEVGQGRMWAAYGSPCEHAFLPYSLEPPRRRSRSGVHG